MRFLADENVSRLVIDALRNAGHEVVSIRETQSGIDDPKVLDVAREAALILITEDRDFGELVVRRKLPVRGVILLELDRLTNEREAERVQRFVADRSDRDLTDMLIVLEPTRTRIRPLSGP